MVDIFWIIFCVGMVIAFFYFGYRHDYRRNSKEFKRSIIVIPLTALSFFYGLPYVSGWIAKWIRDAEKDV